MPRSDYLPYSHPSINILRVQPGCFYDFFSVSYLFRVGVSVQLAHFLGHTIGVLKKGRRVELMVNNVVRHSLGTFSLKLKFTSNVSSSSSLVKTRFTQVSLSHSKFILPVLTSTLPPWTTLCMLYISALHGPELILCKGTNVRQRELDILVLKRTCFLFLNGSMSIQDSSFPVRKPYSLLIKHKT